MIDPNSRREGLDDLIACAWAAHRRAVTDGLGAIKSSIPVLWFGDSNSYRDSEVRVITVAKNPSSDEFPTRSRFLRFPSAAADLSSAANLRASYNEYFRRDRSPYLPWFCRLEPLLEGFGASPTGRLRNVSLHLDLYTPVATDPTWGELPPGTKAKLMKDGVPIWNSLVRVLRPDVILLAAGPDQQSHLNCTWTEAPRPLLGWSGNKALSFGRARFAPGCEPLVVLGVNMRGSPFGALSNEEKRRVAALVGRASEPRSRPPPSPADTAPPNEPSTPPTSSWAAPGAVPAEPQLHESLHDVAEQLREWTAANDGVVENVRLDGVFGGSRGGGKPLIGWTAEGFRPEDYSNGILDGRAFNRVFCLAGDSRRTAVQAFLDLYDERSGDPRAIFECEESRSRGSPRSLKLSLRTHPHVAHWQCLASDQREAQLRARLRR